MSRWVGWLVILALFCAGPVPSAQCADAAAAHDQKDPFKQALDLTIWTIVVFLVLLLVLKRFAWKPMLEGLQRREASINDALENARKAREEAEKVRARYQHEIAHAHETVREILDEARRDAAHAKEEMMASARTEIQAERDRGRREIKTATDQALKELWDQSAKLATLISSKAIRRELNVDDHRRLFDEAVSELKEANVGWRDRLI
jgi:F-type H+-transporting ATPase subunit b